MHYIFSPQGKVLLDIVQQKAITSNFDSAKTALFCSNLVSAKSKETLSLGDEYKVHLSLAIDIVISRAKIAKDNPLESWYKDGFFIKSSLEQSTRPEVAKIHAKLFEGCQHVLEISTGLGFDTAEIAKVAKQVTTIEKNELVAEFARRNFIAQGLNNIEVITGDFLTVKNSLALATFDGIWADPSRKSSTGEKIKDPNLYEPSLESVLSLTKPLISGGDLSKTIGIKLSPSIDIDEKEFKLFWVGYNNDCLEQVLTNADSITDGETLIVGSVGSQASVPASRTVKRYASSTKTTPDDYKFISLDKIQDHLLKQEFIYLIEPHSALIRSGKLNNFYFENNIYLIDSKIAYGISISPDATNLLSKEEATFFFNSFEIKEALPYHPKKINELINEYKLTAKTTIKKRGFPKEPEEIRKELKFFKTKSNTEVIDDNCILIFTRIGDKHIVFFTYAKK